MLESHLCNFQKTLYQECAEASAKHPNLMRLSGLPVLLVGCTAGLIRIIAGIAENALRGLGHVLGAPFSNKCNAKKGAFFICLSLSASATLLIHPLSVICSIASIFISPKNSYDKLSNAQQPTDLDAMYDEADRKARRSQQLNLLLHRVNCESIMMTNRAS